MYRKFTADYIFNGHEILPGAAVLITDLSGFVIDLVDPADAGDAIEVFSGLLTPGFTNAHCHLELSHLKGMIPEKTGLVEFVQQVMGKRGCASELKMDAMMQAEAEMYHNGIVAVGDICNTADSIPVKQRSKLLWHNFIEVSGFVDATAQNRLDDMKKVFDQFAVSGNKQNTTFSPHAPYSVSKKLFQLLNDETSDQLISIHNQECAAENELYQHKNGGFLELYKNFGIDSSGFEPTGKSSIASWLPMFNSGQRIISVHNTFTSAEDISFSGSRPPNISNPVFYCLCINANQYIEQATPPVNLLMEMKANIIIGTDSYASNRQLNILEEIKAIQRDTHYTISLEEILQWATLDGARALQFGDVAGSFEKGKRPGVILIEGLNNLKTAPGSVARRIL